MNKILITFLFLLSTYSSYSQDNKISVILPDCGIDSDWTEIKPYLNEEYWGIYEEKEYHHWDNFLVEKYSNTKISVPKFLIQGLNLKNKQFTTGKWIDRMLYLGESLYFSIYNLQDEENSKSYSIYAKGDLIEAENGKFPYFKKIENYELIVESHRDNLRQTIIKMDLFSFPSGGFEGGVYIYWIGDLNGDNLLDMLIGVSNDYRGQSISLFLSDNKTTKLFKEYIVSGCSID